MQLSDAHCHVADRAFVQQLKRQHIFTTINCATPAEFTQNQTWVGRSRYLRLSAGVHPWQVDKVSLNQMMPILQQVPIIGEIGLDNVWTKTDLALQQQVFSKQLSYAEQAHKPVIVHVKGMAPAALKIMRPYFTTFLIHWYDDLTYLNDFLALGCYVSIGPSFARDANVIKVMHQVPLEKVLVESDGLSGMGWALNQELPLAAYPQRLAACIRTLAQIHHLTSDQLAAQLVANLKRFWLAEN
ncbi:MULTISPECIES: TatD family hydrolase [Loigolactobacillus]|uniref:DNAase n=1 Tax=Loigolactobacillus backii TaxID=375175 RepID=A0A192H040_9LACO|nr:MULTISPECIES: TatD family hydrolase [Loigolactobacillus]ANK60821.1 DNAase [Loigolactobacillus backii]ANK61607.1 DNAase [Loigolactobacillus backii]ANK65775.1 DNAase [Loigolactobacillus backii]ANK68251.1 DNAase [Loigolactobacillus backii]ANK69193.1 DNAase [Loigolactobacillus backii]